MFEIHETSERNISATRDPATNKTSITVSRTFNLVSESPSDVITAGQALNDFGVSTGTGHPQNPFYICDNIDVSQESPIFFTATAQYNSPSTEAGEDPVLDPPDISYTTISTTEPTDSDVSGNPIMTAAGETFEGVTMKISDLGIAIKKNYAIFDPQLFWSYINKVNSDSFLGFPPGTCIVDDISATLKANDETQYWEVSVRIIVRFPFARTDDQAWDIRLRHAGYRCLDYEYDKDTGEPALDDEGNEIIVPMRCVDGNQEDATQPMPLDEFGFQQDELEDPPVFVFFRLYGRVAFATMNLI